MKKLISCLLIVSILLLLLSGCGNDGPADSESSAKKKTTTAEQSTDPTGKTSAQTEPSATQPEETKAIIHPYNEILSIYSAEKPRQVLVQDTDLYETMVHGRYFDLWDRRSIYFTEPKLYGFENVLYNIQNDNSVAAWLADNVGAQALHQKADRNNYVRLLLMLIVMQS